MSLGQELQQKEKSCRWVMNLGNEQKQSPRGVSMKRCSENMQQIYRRTPFTKKTSGWLLLAMNINFLIFIILLIDNDEAWTTKL